MENYEIISDGTRREIRGLELWCIEHESLSALAVLAMAILIVATTFILFV